MINANKEKLSSFFVGNNIYEVPFFQRSYVWNEESNNTRAADLAAEALAIWPASASIIHS